MQDLAKNFDLNLASLSLTAPTNTCVAIVIVNWNGKNDTLRCLNSLRSLENQDFVVIISDNASADDSTEAFCLWARQQEMSCAVQTADSKAEFSGAALTIVKMGCNAGFAAANNVATRLALQNPAISTFWFLNNDTEVLPHSLRALQLRMADDPAIGVCGSTLVYLRDPQIVQAVGVHFSLLTGGGYQIAEALSLNALPPREKVESALTYVPGASMLVTREFLETVGLMEERYFLYCEELDWSIRNRGRFRFGWAPDSVVLHKEGGSIGTDTTSRQSDLSLYYQAVNMMRLMARYRPLYLPIIMLRTLLKALRFQLRGDRAGFEVLCLAFADFFQHRFRKDGSGLSSAKVG